MDLENLRKGGYEDWYISPSQQFIDEVREYYCKKEVELTDQQIIKAYFKSLISGKEI